VVAAEHPDRYLVIDGYPRIAALEQLGRDTVKAVVWSLSEMEALLLDPDPHSEEALILKTVPEIACYVGKVDLTRLTSDSEFRRSVFDRFLDELSLKGPEFPFNPPRPLLDLIAALD
jgi:hypothetical protein